MKTTLNSALPSQIETECLVVTVLDLAENSNGDPNAKPNPQLQIADKAVSDAASDLIASGEVTGKALETTLLHKPQGLKAKRLLLIGGGKATKFTSSELRKIAGAAVRALKAKDLKSFVLVAPSGVDDAAKSIVEGAVVGNFDADYYRSDRKDQKIDELIIATPKGANQRSWTNGIERGRIIGESQNFTRDLVNEPSNRMTPTILADRAEAMCKETGLACEIYGPDKIKALKMGAFWSVSQGSDEEPRLIVMRYEPERAPKKRVLGLVGKGITFDTGGISIKPADGMEKMKYDMAGGAAMIGAMRAIALLKPNIRVIGIVCASENMPSGKAQKPGDVQIAMSGKSIEIINTDAEGRLVLADGLHYAKELGCTHLIDAATLTGAVVVALGMVNVGVFSNDDDFYTRFNQSLAKSGEKMWRLPAEDEYKDMIKSDIADIKNTGGRWGGAVTAAMFLKEFVGDTPWMHLDIAGTAWLEDTKPWIAKGPSGVPVRSLVEFVQDFSGK
ncbi:MAG TPA: leucyl aminopeptidase [Verrucomicrobiae bacterium]|jgi:leucyl aminopeptidase|nr:leucyl aminopeptidase [Verrucomicrobiae bacterium]